MSVDRINPKIGYIKGNIALDISFSRGTVSNSNFLEFETNGIVTEFSSIEMKNLLFKNISGNGITASERSFVNLHDTEFYDISDTTIICYEHSEISGDNIKISNSKVGFGIKPDNKNIKLKSKIHCSKTEFSSVDIPYSNSKESIIISQ